MAPKASKSAKQEDWCAILKLVMEKGPLSGQTLNFEPGSCIRVGRIVRGNTVYIKDAGISSKHLLIQAQPTPDLGYRRWTVTDLGSSNGTFFNGSQLEPSAPAVLTDGDVISIGEATTIRVEFEVSGGGSECNSENVRRNPRRRGKNGRVDLGVIDENSELGRDGNDQENRLDLKGRCVIGEVEVLGDSNRNLVAENEGKVTGRRTRGSKARELGNEVEEVVALEISRKASLRRPKASRKNENSEINVDAVKGKADGRNGGLRTRSSSKDEQLFQESKDTGVVGLERGSRRSTRNSKKIESFDKDCIIIEGKSAKKGILLHVEAFLELKEEHELIEKGTDFGRLDACTPEAKDHKSRTDESVVDLEKMTLGEWFDFMEAYMPKQIIQVTEEMITGMKQKAEKVHEFMLQQKNAKEAMNEAAR
ncbi:FHA domain-containing protein At4g14490-like [Henckelia pumila]|uniref:FHA domain-containing protein At4g14490-like n=1 Tax=Henckelia pumila TaxID=405737 RepID=UPI003C6E3004